MSQTEKKRSSRVSADENNKADRRSSRHSRSSTMSYGGSISDIEADNESDKYRKMAKRLARDKSELKDKLRRLLDDIDQRTRDHRVELEKTQDYFQDQINELVDERDKAREETEAIRDVILEEKEKLREQYEQKISKQKESLEKRYGSKDSQVVKRLENTIATLQDRLNKQIEDTAEQQINVEKEEQLRTKITGLEEQLQKVKELYIKDRKAFSDEKEEIVRRLHDNEQKVVQITNEKNLAVVALQNIKDQVGKRTQELELQRDTLIANANKDVEQTKINYEKKQEEFMQMCKKSIADFKQESERKFDASEQKHKLQLEKMIKEHEKIVNELTCENSRKIDIYTDNVRQEIEEYKKTIAALQAELSTLGGRYTVKEEEVVKTIERCNTEYLKKYEEKDREINNLRLKNEKIVGESEETVQRLRDQLNQVRETMKKIQENSHAMNNHFVSNLNKQKELADKEIGTRDQTIAQLEYQLKKIGEESVDRFNMIERKAKIIFDENKDITEKCNSMKVAIEKHEQTINGLREENQKLKETMTVLHEQHRQAQFDNGINEQKFKTEIELKKLHNETLTKTNQELNRKIANLGVIIGQNQANLKTAMENANKHLQNSNSKDQEIATMSKDLFIVNDELGRLKKMYSEEVQKKEKYKADSESLVEKERKIVELSKKIDVLATTLYQSEQNIRQKDQQEKSLMEKYKADAGSLAEKERKIVELSKKIDVLTETLYQCEQNILQKDQQEKSLMEKYKQETESLAKELEDKTKECKKLQEDIIDVKSSGGIILTNMNNELGVKNNDIKLLQQKLDELKDQNDKIAELSTMLKTTQKDLEKMTVESKKDKEDLAVLRTKEAGYSKYTEENNNLKAAIINMKTSHDRFTYEKNSEIYKINKKITEFEQNREKIQQELTKAKNETLEVSKKLVVSEKMVKDLELEKNAILNSQSELKEKCINSLNLQQEKYDKEIANKIERIKELEIILTEKLLKKD